MEVSGAMLEVSVAMFHVSGATLEVYGAGAMTPTPDSLAPPLPPPMLLVALRLHSLPLSLAGQIAYLAPLVARVDSTTG